MRVVFMGTPQFAADILSGLIASSHQVVGVVTRPDAVRGRGKKLVASPVKEVALANGIPVLELSSFKNADAQDTLSSFNADVFCVAAYGALLTESVLNMPRFGCLNVHGSLLPRWRGAAPVERAILAGDKCTGVSIMQMEKGLDTGAFTEVREVPLDGLTSDEVFKQLAVAGSEALIAVLDKLEAGTAIEWTVQDEAKVTYAEKLAKSEFNLSPTMETEGAMRLIRAAGSSHPCRCIVADREVTVVAAKPLQASEAPVLSVEPGRVAFTAKRLYAGFADGALELLQVKPQGKKEMDASSFAAGIQGIKKNGAAWRGLDE